MKRRLLDLFENLKRHLKLVREQNRVIKFCWFMYSTLLSFLLVGLIYFAAYFFFGFEIEYKNILYTQRALFFLIGIRLWVLYFRGMRFFGSQKLLSITKKISDVFAISEEDRKEIVWLRSNMRRKHTPRLWKHIDKHFRKYTKGFYLYIFIFLTYVFPGFQSQVMTPSLAFCTFFYWNFFLLFFVTEFIINTWIFFYYGIHKNEYRLWNSPLSKEKFWRMLCEQCQREKILRNFGLVSLAVSGAVSGAVTTDSFWLYFNPESEGPFRSAYRKMRGLPPIENMMELDVEAKRSTIESNNAQAAYWRQLTEDLNKNKAGISADEHKPISFDSDFSDFVSDKKKIDE